MPKAIEQIVDAYVRLSDREALEDLMAHRQKLAVDIKSRTDFDFSLAIGQIDDDIAVIEAGVEKLRAAESSSG
jgi:hypothetical protein